jgi:hypothetical protein
MVNNTVIRKIQAEYFDQTSYSTAKSLLGARRQEDKALNTTATATDTNIQCN